MGKKGGSPKNQMSERQWPVIRQTGPNACYDTFRGSGLIDVLAPDERPSSSFTAAPNPFIGDDTIDALEPSWPEQQRAVRQERKRLSLPALPREPLRNKLLIAFGSELAAASAVAALEHATASIKRDGLLTGEDSQGCMLSEPVEQPSPLLVQSR